METIQDLLKELENNGKNVRELEQPSSPATATVCWEIYGRGGKGLEELLLFDLDVEYSRETFRKMDLSKVNISSWDGERTVQGLTYTGNLKDFVKTILG